MIAHHQWAHERTRTNVRNVLSPEATRYSQATCKPKALDDPDNLEVARAKSLGRALPMFGKDLPAPQPPQPRLP